MKVLNDQKNQNHSQTGRAHMEEIKRLKDKYAITYLDKAGQNMVFMCKTLYLNLVNNQLFGSKESGTYIPVRLNINGVNELFIAETAELSLPSSNKDISLPHLFLIVKAHKTQ